MLIGSTSAITGFTSMGGDMTDALHRRAVERRVGPPRRPELCRSGSLIERELGRVVLGDRAMWSSISILVKVINEDEGLGERAHNTARLRRDNCRKTTTRVLVGRPLHWVSASLGAKVSALVSVSFGVPPRPNRRRAGTHVLVRCGC